MSGKNWQKLFIWIEFDPSLSVSWQLIEIFGWFKSFPFFLRLEKTTQYGVLDSCHQQVARCIQYSGFRCNTVASNRRRRITSNFKFHSFRIQIFWISMKFFAEFREKFSHRIFSWTIYSTPRNRNCNAETFGSTIDSLP